MEAITHFYKHHLGDYARDAGHLSWLEDAAYTRLLRSYYLRELPIPSDLAETTRLVRAVTRREKEAVTHVLNEFFELREDGFHNARADKEIQQYQAQASTNRRIARERIVVRSVNEASTKGTPNQEPLTTNQEPEVNLKPKNKSKSGSAFAPPDWISPENWKGFEAMRDKLKKPMTDRARQMIVDELEKLQQAGEDPELCLAQSERNSWQDVYPLKDKSGNGSNGAGPPQPDPSCAKCGGSTSVGFIHTSDGRVCSRCRAGS